MNFLPYRLFGVDRRAYRTLVGAFWTLSMRATTGLIAGRGAGKEASVKMAWLMYGAYGMFASFAALAGFQRAHYGAIIATATLFLVGMAVVADFATVVISPGDDEILFHRPIDSRTYLAARLSVAGIHASILAAAFSTIPAIAGAFAYHQPLYLPLILATSIATGLFALVLAFTVYRVALRRLGTERLRTLLAYLPGALSILLALGPQFLMRRTGGGAIPHMDAVLHWLPPVWFAAVPEAILGEHDPVTLLHAALGVAVLPVAVFLLIRALGRGFLEDLLRLVADKGSSAVNPAKALRPVLPGPFARRVLGLSSPEASAGYLLYVGAMRSRDARARQFPMLMMPFAFVILGWTGARSTSIYASSAMYLLGVGGATLLGSLPFHEHYAAAWVYEAWPLQRYGTFYTGLIRALLFRHLIPVFLLLFALMMVGRPSLETALGIIHGFLGSMLALPFIAMGNRQPPFTKPFRAGEQTEMLGIFFVTLLVVGVVGGLHALFLYFIPWGYAVTVPGFVLGFVLWLRAIRIRLDRSPPAWLLPARTAHWG